MVDNNDPLIPNLVRQLADVLREKDLTEIEYQTQDCSVRVVKSVSLPVSQPIFQTHIPSQIQAELPSPMGVIKAPMVGTVYLSPQPDADAFIKEGQQIAEGATLLIIEAMKVMNPLRAPRSGTIKKLLVRNGEPVEYDHPLLVLE